MPERQYFYTPIAIENHNIGAVDVNGDYITSISMTPGATDPAPPMDMIPVSCDELICLRADTTRDRCVVSLPQTIEHIYMGGIQSDLANLTLGGEWQQVNRAEIESEYPNMDQFADDALIDFTVEGE